jgi:hypothetical protein
MEFCIQNIVAGKSVVFFLLEIFITHSNIRCIFYIGSCIQYLKGLKQEVLEEIPFLTELLGDLTIEVNISSPFTIYTMNGDLIFPIWLLKSKIYRNFGIVTFRKYKRNLN